MQSHNDMSAISRNRYDTGRKPRLLSHAVTCLVTPAAAQSHAHPNATQLPSPKHFHTLTQVPWNTCMLTTTRLHTISPGQALPDTHTPSHLCIIQGAQLLPAQPIPGTWIPELYSQSILPPPSFPPFQGWSKSGTKAQCPLLPSPFLSPSFWRPAPLSSCSS